MAEVSHGDTVPLSGGQSHEIRNLSDLKGRGGKVFGKREKAQVPICIFPPQRSKKCIDNMRFKLISIISFCF